MDTKALGDYEKSHNFNNEEEQSNEMSIMVSDNERIIRRIESLTYDYSFDIDILKACKKALIECRDITLSSGYISPSIVSKIENMIEAKYGKNTSRRGK